MLSHVVTRFDTSGPIRPSVRVRPPTRRTFLNFLSKGQESQEQRVTICRLEEECARCEERARMAEKTAEEKVKPQQ